MYVLQYMLVVHLVNPKFGKFKKKEKKLVNI